MIKRSVKIVLPLPLEACFALVEKLGNGTKDWEEDHRDDRGIFWSGLDYTFDVQLTAISENKTVVEMIASSSGFIDLFDRMERKVKIFSAQLKNRAKPLSRFKSVDSSNRRDLIKRNSIDKENRIFLMQLVGVYVLIGIEVVTVILYTSVKRDGDFLNLLFRLSLALEYFELSPFYLIGGLAGGFHAGMLKAFSWQVNQDAKQLLKIISVLSLIPLAPFLFFELIIAFMPGPGVFDLFHPLIPFSFMAKIFLSLLAGWVIFSLTSILVSWVRKWRIK